MEKILLEQLSQKITTDERLLVIVSAEWCGECRMLKLLIDKVKEDYPEIVFAEIDADQDDLWENKDFEVKEVPTFLLFKNGEMIKTVSGYQYEEKLRELLDELKNK